VPEVEIDAEGKEAVLEPVEHKGHRAYVFKKWSGGLDLGLSAEGDNDEDEEWEGDSELSVGRRAALLKGLNLPASVLVAPESIFRVKFAISTAPGLSWVWDWTARALSEDFAVVTEYVGDVDDEGEPTQVWGVVTRDDIARSTALLFCRADTPEGSRFAGNFWDEMAADGIELPDLYRLLLAYEGLGGDAVITMDGMNLVNFQAQGMEQDFSDLSELLDKDPEKYGYRGVAEDSE
jgi:hypothetical protein